MSRVTSRQNLRFIVVGGSSTLSDGSQGICTTTPSTKRLKTLSMAQSDGKQGLHVRCPRILENRRGGGRWHAALAPGRRKLSMAGALWMYVVNLPRAGAGVVFVVTVSSQSLVLYSDCAIVLRRSYPCLRGTDKYDGTSYIVWGGVVPPCCDDFVLAFGKCFTHLPRGWGRFRGKGFVSAFGLVWRLRHGVTAFVSMSTWNR